MRQCTKCKIYKPIKNYTLDKTGKDGLRLECRDCKNNRQAKDRIHRLANNQCQYCNHPIYRKSKRMCIRHLAIHRAKGWRHKGINITFSVYRSTLKKQNYKCKICKTKLALFGYNTTVDHCHTTKIIRGILCKNCNLMLGTAEDSIKTLQHAILYLQNNASIVQ